MAIYIDACDKRRMLKVAKALTACGHPDAAGALLGAINTNDYTRWAAALQVIGAVPESVLREAGLTADAASAIPSITHAKPQQDVPSVHQAQR